MSNVYHDRYMIKKTNGQKLSEYKANENQRKEHTTINMCEVYSLWLCITIVCVICGACQRTDMHIHCLLYILYDGYHGCMVDRVM